MGQVLTINLLGAMKTLSLLYTFSPIVYPSSVHPHTPPSSHPPSPNPPSSPTPLSVNLAHQAHDEFRVGRANKLCFLHEIQIHCQPTQNHDDHPSPKPTPVKTHDKFGVSDGDEVHFIHGMSGGLFMPKGSGHQLTHDYNNPLPRACAETPPSGSSPVEPDDVSRQIYPHVINTT